jgi:hydrogenase expression/formation protein HypD
MKHLAEYRDVGRARALAAEIRRIVTRPWTLMEVCGGQTHSLIRNGIDQMLPEGVEMIHGPGCPVCVTPLSVIDKALSIAARPDVILCSFGDMLRVPGSGEDLLTVKARGGDVRVVYSPLDAVALARRHPGRQVVFLAIGFETTAPASAMAVKVAKRQGLDNFSMLVSHMLVPPAIEAVARSPGNRARAFLAAGHVCSVMGTRQYPALARRLRVPIVVAGFEPLDLLDAIRRALVQLEAGRAEVENAYPRSVSESGNEAAREVIEEVFVVTDRVWRGIGRIPDSGWKLAAEYRDFDAEERFELEGIAVVEPSLCRSGEVLTGAIRPHECPLFGRECTPSTPLGATMVSGEGACAAYHLAGRAAAGAGVSSLARDARVRP